VRKTRAFARSLDCPERKRLPCFKVRIFVVNEIKVTVVRETCKRLSVSER
jgi:hypothetical protein